MNNVMLRAQYLDALGVPEFLYIQPNANNVGNPQDKKIHTQCLVIETQNNRSFCQPGKTQDFLFKMLAAIDIKNDDIKCVSIDIDDLTHTLSQYNARTVLLMSKGLTPVLDTHFATHHPSEILINQVLKREAWEVLKRMKACLK